MNRTTLYRLQKYPNKPVLIISNHFSFLDPFLVGYSLPLRVYFRIAPIRFITANKYYYSKINLLLRLIGCYPAHPTHEKEDRGRFGTKKSSDLLNSGQSVMIFPEGKRVINDQISAKYGVIKILQNTNCQVLLCKISKKKVIEIKHKNISTSVIREIDDPNEIMKKIYSL